MSDNTAVALIVIALAFGCFGYFGFENYNSTKIESQKIQFKIDSLNYLKGKQ